MPIAHTIFDVFAFTVALLELIHLYREGKIARRLWIIPTLIGLLTGLCSVVIYDWVQHQAAISRSEARITDMLRAEAKTFDELAHGLEFDDLPFIFQGCRESW